MKTKVTENLIDLNGYDLGKSQYSKGKNLRKTSKNNYLRTKGNDESGFLSKTNMAYNESDSESKGEKNRSNQKKKGKGKIKSKRV